MTPSPELFAKLLPDRLEWAHAGKRWLLVWTIPGIDNREVLETEYLHLCHRIELMLSPDEYAKFARRIGELSETSRISAPWEARLTALAEVKGLK